MSTEPPPPDDSEVRTTGVVFIGRFNPRIFQPTWFALRGLLAEADAEPGSLIITDAVAAFRTREINVFCAQDRCQFTTTSTTPTPDIVRDLCVGTFTLLPETPIRQVGINHTAQLPPSVQTWDKVAALFGDPHDSFAVLDDEQELATLELRAARTGDTVGQRTVTLQQSIQFPGGVYVHVNDHMEVHPDLGDAEGAFGATDAISALQREWDTSREIAEIVIHRVAQRR